ncbi:glycosyltransferase family 9 protein [Chromobacterium sp. Beijing]|uniref:glycosyltransferase family 9 protein n=1 Tax=Chromobacterium sp. Beijing TaxID=2735795 RepID=UPI001F37B7B3|nr:glycosyltransferase family 9 protein [Chromobacterium sp. Beijing]UJB33439.1 glycosyltransferase family 9 protein [Chromobacterium sp. Beijing]
MRPGRFPGRLLIFTALLLRLPWQWLRRKPDPERTRRVLILHQFLLGDALMATSLLAKARERFPKAEIVLACPPGQAPLYASRPYGIRPLPWQPRDFASIRRLFAEARFDIAYLMGENRLSFLARAIGARWIVGFAGETPRYKNWLLDEAVAYAGQPEAWTDTAARLIDGPEPQPFRLRDWPVAAEGLPPLPPRFVVLHVGASSATRFWPAASWNRVAATARACRCVVLWSCGPGEQHLLSAVELGPDDIVMAGTLSLAQLRAVLSRARACVCPDTGIAHLAKVAGAPLLMLFGPGSETLFGASRFFAGFACVGVGPAWFPCRNQRSVHYRDVDWALRCFRKFGDQAGECRQAQCMAALPAGQVAETLEKLLHE